MGRGVERFGLEQTVQEERNAEDGEEAADAQTDMRFTSEKSQHEHQPEADAHQRDACPAIPSMATIPAPLIAISHAIVAIHRPVEPPWIGLWGGDKAALDHRDALPDFELADTGARHRVDDRNNNPGDNRDDWQKRRPGHWRP